MQEQRVKLPVWEKRENILDAMEKNQVLVISGMTGYVRKYECCVSLIERPFTVRCMFYLRCGKTTQIPQFILDDSLSGRGERVANIICTQPRRISAITVATRVAQERSETLGHSTGYQIRLETVKVTISFSFRQTHKHIHKCINCISGIQLRYQIYVVFNERYKL